MSPTLTDDKTIEAVVMRRVFWRLMPFLLLAYLICYIDRVNVGFASLQMNKAIGIDSKTYGLGAGIFFIGYFLLEVPSNLGLQRFGARTWIARIMISWGIVSGAFALVAGPASFLSLRFILGAAEAGFFPGVILYLTYWFPAEHRARIIGIFMVAIPVAGLTGSPISGAILGLDGRLGLGGWQWLFILEAVPAILMGIAAFVWLTDRPEHAHWLAPEQRAWLVAKLDAERRRPTARVAQLSVWRVMSNKYVLVMALVYSGAAGASSALALWQPQLIKSFGLTNWETGLLNAVPYAIAAVWMVIWGRNSDRTGERVWHNALPLGWMVLAMVATFAVTQLWMLIPLLALILAGTYACKGPFWALSSEWLAAPVAAAGLAQINALGNLSGFFCNFLIGWIKASTGSFPLALMPIAALAAIGTVCVILVGRGQPRTAAIRV
ncbi:MAG TPA: MFS transporter [Acetobacteraceae bacterium]